MNKWKLAPKQPDELMQHNSFGFLSAALEPFHKAYWLLVLDIIPINKLFGSSVHNRKENTPKRWQYDNS